MGVLIDASILLDNERGRSDLEERVAGREAEPFYVSVITVSELLHGVHRADTPSRRAHRSVFVEAVIDRFPILPIDLPTARLHAEAGAQLAAEGRTVGAHDLWIAAAALAHGLTLATADLREFRRVPGLDVEEW